MIPKTTFIAAGLLGAFAAAGVGLVASTYQSTEEKIIENERNKLMRSVDEVLSTDRYNNDLVSDYLDIEDPELLPPTGSTRVYRAYKNQQPIAAVFPIVAPDGYNGAIRLLVAVNMDGSISGTRVLNHKETPGLGDLIDIARSDWITNFTGHSLDNLKESDWKVKKDGGIFDQFTGATITPRAVVATIHRGIHFFNKHRNKIFPKTSPLK